MAYPLVIALVVLPTASRESVTFLTFLSSLDISAIPPALSVTGPYASNAITIPARASIEVTEIAIPNNPANLKEKIIPKQMISAGIAVATKLTANP